MRPSDPFTIGSCCGALACLSNRYPYSGDSAFSSSCARSRRYPSSRRDAVGRLPPPATGHRVKKSGAFVSQASDYPLAREGIVTAGYFETFQTKVLSGREFTPADVATSQAVAIVNQSFARTHFPAVDPLGRRVKRIRPGSNEPWMTIVGVVPDLIMEGIGNNNASAVGYYIPIPQTMSRRRATRSDPRGAGRADVAKSDPR